MAGKFKGRKLKGPNDLNIRPTLDRVKESIFNVLGKDIAKSKVLDLFSGSGSLGLEAISRGCNMVYFVDDSIESISLIKSNISLIPEIENRYTVIKSDAVKFIRSFNDFIWDYIFLDPPFKIDNKIMTEIFNILFNSKIIDENSVIIYEFFFKRDIKSEIGNFKIFKTSGFGEKKVIYLTKN
ncbi:16S rRNA (guanine(966)-N(2))-methyltransferase RsmD [bacterium]|nr:16S rRNA (guanine(966)-N(2))-methyltransferase RsmD [bacterium]